MKEALPSGSLVCRGQGGFVNRGGCYKEAQASWWQTELDNDHGKGDGTLAGGDSAFCL